MRFPLMLIGSGCLALLPTSLGAEEARLRAIPLSSEITHVQPMTGIVLWTTNPNNRGDWIQLEYSYLRYDDIEREPGQYDWSPVEVILEDVASRGHQAILRFYFVYPGKDSAVPAYIKALPDYNQTEGMSEGKPTTFCDWSHPTLQQATLDFYTAFAERYDRDPRLALVQTGFGLWAEYHIYDGPMELGRTFPDKAYQAKFVRHLSETFEQTPWSVSIDSAVASRSPLAEDPELSALPFGLFDDSFLSRNHGGYNTDCWTALGVDRWKRQPAGGEISYYSDHDQRHALDPEGPYQIPFESLAARFHISYMIGDGQPRYQSTQRIAQAGMALGYRFRVTAFSSAQGRSQVTITNEGIAPLYHDAFVAVDATRAEESLKGLLPGEIKTFSIPAGDTSPRLTIESDRLVPGQRIQFVASLQANP
jgi:hypothetical protein